MKSYSKNYRSTSAKPIKKYSGTVCQSRRKFLSEWIKFLLPRDCKPLEDNIKTGLIPYKLIQKFFPNLSLGGYNPNPNKAQAYNNLHLIINLIFKEFPNCELPSVNDILKKGSNECWTLINTIFKLFQMAEVKKNWDNCVEWYRSILKLYDIDVKKTGFVLNSQNGVYFACILNCYTGFKLSNVYKNPSPQETLSNLSQVFEALREKIVPFNDITEFLKNSDEEVNCLTVFLVFKAYRYDVPNLPVRERLDFKQKPQLTVNITDSLISLSSFESLEYSKSTIISKEPSELHLDAHITPKWNRSKLPEILTDDSTVHSLQPEISYDTVSMADTSYTQRTSEKLSKIEKENSMSERKSMYIADLRAKQQTIREIPSLKHLRTLPRTPDDDFLCFLITPRLLKMLKPAIGTFIFSVVLDPKNFSMKNEIYFLEWKNFDLKLIGKISSVEISSCEYFGRNLSVKTSNQELLIQCLDEKEARFYSFGLNKLIKPKTLFSRDMSCNELISNIQ